MSRKRKKKPGVAGWWSDSQRIQLVTTWLATGNLALAAATLEIPEVTARRWKSQEWFQKMVEDIRNEENLQLDAKLSKVVTKSVDALLDRVENGDFQYDQKTGQLVRKPISARDAAKVTTDMIDRRELLQGKKEKTTSDARKIEDRLVALASEFIKFSSAKTIDVQPERIVNDTSSS
jgi:hypothetical protein